MFNITLTLGLYRTYLLVSQVWSYRKQEGTGEDLFLRTECLNTVRPAISIEGERNTRLAHLESTRPGS